MEPPGAIKWDYKTPAFLAGGLAVAVFLFLFFLAYEKSESLNAGLTFAGTLLGSITGYYFGGQKRVPGKRSNAQDTESAVDAQEKEEEEEE